MPQKKKTTRARNPKSRAPARPVRNEWDDVKIRYAVVGQGYISQIAVLPAFKHAQKNSELIALISGDPVKRKALSRKYHVPVTASYEEFEECLLQNDIDAVYIALPNHLHQEYVERAARIGVHVLCEKPMAVSEEECRSMIDTARDNNVKLMIAYRLHFDLANLKSIEAIRSGRLGAVRYFQSSFSMQVKEGNIRLNPTELGGGPVYDLGIYCINAARYLFQDEPIEVFAMGATNRADGRFLKTMEMMSATLRFPRERLATFTASYGASDMSSFEVVGTEGSLCVDSAYDFAEPICITLKEGSHTREMEFKKRDQFAPELLYFSDCILHDKEPEPSGWEGLLDIRIIEAVHRSYYSGQPVKLVQERKFDRPTMRQEIHRPPVSRPKLIHATTASQEG